jgi:hypothetical protein
MSTRRIGYETGRTEISETGTHAAVFAELVTLSRPIVSHYLSDLYHDALWLSRNLTGSDTTFYYGLRETGTSIGFDADLVGAHNVALYRIRVYVVDGETSVTRSAVFPT